MIWRQLPAAPTPAASACCQNVWDCWPSDWRSYQLCGLPWSMAALEMLLVPACCELAVVQLPKMWCERVVPTLYLTLTVRHPITTASLLLWGLPRNEARGGGKPPFIKWAIQYWVRFWRNTQSSGISHMPQLYLKTIFFYFSGLGRKAWKQVLSLPGEVA